MMKFSKQLGAAILSGCMLVSATGIPVFAADSEDPAEPVVMTAEIQLKGTSAEAKGSNVTVAGTTVTISASGNYAISGTLDDGQIVVNVPDLTADPGTVKLFLNGVSVTGVKEAPLYIVNAEKTSLNLGDGTENFFYDGGKFTETEAVIFAKDDITVKSGGELGTGKLRVEAKNDNYGIHCNNDFKMTGGNLKVKTESTDGIRGKTSVEIKGGNLDVNAGGDGIKSTKGEVLISDGTMRIKASNDAVQGETKLEISGGSLVANGDRSLTNAAGTVNITGGKILATATDNQIPKLTSTQPVLTFQLSEQIVKDNPIRLLSGSDVVFEENPDKKMNFVMVSSPDLKSGSTYEVQIGDAGKAEAVLSADQMLTDIGTVTVNPKLAVNYDIDGNGTASVADAVLLARMVASDKTVVVDHDVVERADLDGDGTVAVPDLTQIIKFLAGRFT